MSTVATSAQFQPQQQTQPQQATSQPSSVWQQSSKNNNNNHLAQVEYASQNQQQQQQPVYYQAMQSNPQPASSGQFQFPSLLPPTYQQVYVAHSSQPPSQTTQQQQQQQSHHHHHQQQPHVIQIQHHPHHQSQPDYHHLNNQPNYDSGSNSVAAILRRYPLAPQPSYVFQCQQPSQSQTPHQQQQQQQQHIQTVQLEQGHPQQQQHQVHQHQPNVYYAYQQNPQQLVQYSHPQGPYQQPLQFIQYTHEHYYSQQQQPQQAHKFASYSPQPTQQNLNTEPPREQQYHHPESSSPAKSGNTGFQGPAFLQDSMNSSYPLPFAQPTSSSQPPQQVSPSATSHQSHQIQKQSGPLPPTYNPEMYATTTVSDGNSNNNDVNPYSRMSREELSPLLIPKLKRGRPRKYPDHPTSGGFLKPKKRRHIVLPMEYPVNEPGYPYGTEEYGQMSKQGTELDMPAVIDLTDHLDESDPSMQSSRNYVDNYLPHEMYQQEWQAKDLPHTDYERSKGKRGRKAKLAASLLGESTEMLPPLNPDTVPTQQLQPVPEEQQLQFNNPEPESMYASSEFLNSQNLLLKKSGIGDDLHPQVASFSRPLIGLTPVAPQIVKQNGTYDADGNVTAVGLQWRRLTLPELIDLMVVVDFISLFGKELLNLPKVSITLASLESLLYSLPAGYKNLLRVYRRLLRCLYPKTRYKAFSIIELPSLLSHHFAQSRTHSDEKLAFAFDTTEFPMIPPHIHAAALAALTTSIMSGTVFHNTIEEAQEQSESLRKEYGQAKRKTSDLRLNLRILDDQVLQLDQSIRNIEIAIQEAKDAFSSNEGLVESTHPDDSAQKQQIDTTGSSDDTTAADEGERGDHPMDATTTVTQTDQNGEATSPAGTDYMDAMSQGGASNHSLQTLKSQGGVSKRMQSLEASKARKEAEKEARQEIQRIQKERKKVMAQVAEAEVEAKNAEAEEAKLREEFELNGKKIRMSSIRYLGVDRNGCVYIWLDLGTNVLSPPRPPTPPQPEPIPEPEPVAEPVEAEPVEEAGGIMIEIPAIPSSDASPEVTPKSKVRRSSRKRGAKHEAETPANDTQVNGGDKESGAKDQGKEPSKAPISSAASLASLPPASEVELLPAEPGYPVYGLLVESVSEPGEEEVIKPETVSSPVSDATENIERVQTAEPPVTPKWQTVGTVWDLKDLLRSFNERGVRERELIMALRERLVPLKVEIPMITQSKFRNPWHMDVHEGDDELQKSLTCFNEWLKHTGVELGTPKTFSESKVVGAAGVFCQTPFSLADQDKLDEVDDIPEDVSYDKVMKIAVLKRLKAMTQLTARGVAVDGRCNLSQKDGDAVSTLSDAIQLARTLAEKRLVERFANEILERLTSVKTWSALALLVADTVREGRNVKYLREWLQDDEGQWVMEEEAAYEKGRKK